MSASKIAAMVVLFAAGIGTLLAMAPSKAPPAQASQVAARPLPKTEVSIVAAAPDVSASTCPPLTRVTPAGARIITDVSGSMQGFLGKKNVENLHAGIESTFNSLGAFKPLSRCLVGTTLDCLRAPSTVAEYDAPKLYNQSSSRLDLALEGPPPVDGCPASDPIDAAQITLLLTDGVQAASTRIAGATIGECADGPNPACVRTLLERRVAAGMGLAIAVLYLPFDGPHYPEMALTQQMWDAAEAHRKELRVDKRFEGKATFAFQKPARLPTSAGQGFRVTGLKPLVLLALSREPALLSSFMGKLKEHLLNFHIVSGEGLFERLVVAPLPPVDARLGDVTRLPGERSAGVKLGAAARKDGVLVQPITCERDGAAELRLGLAGDWSPSAPPVTRSLRLEPVGGALPPAVASAFVADGEKAFKMGLACLQLRPGTVEARYVLMVKSAPQSSADLWWNALSTNNSYQAPERVYGLSEIVVGLLAKQAERPQAAGELVLKIARP